MNKVTHVCEMRQVRSSNIRSAGYIKEANVMFIEFGTTMYEYLNVTPDMYEGFCCADSKGSYFSREIKDHPNVVCIKIPNHYEVDVI